MYGVLRGYSVFSGVLKQKVTLKPRKKNGKTEKKHRMQHYEDRGQRWRLFWSDSILFVSDWSCWYLDEVSVKHLTPKSALYTREVTAASHCRSVPYHGDLSKKLIIQVTLWTHASQEQTFKSTSSSGRCCTFCLKCRQFFLFFFIVFPLTWPLGVLFFAFLFGTINSPSERKTPSGEPAELQAF